MKTKKVLVAISGGIDSSCALYILKNKNYELKAVTLFLWDKESHKRSCCSLSALQRAKRICYRYSVPHITVDSRTFFEKEIVKKNFLEKFLEGKTPNPCTFCNRFLKFGVLIDKMKELGCEFLATGHYARIHKEKDKYFIRKAKDKDRDQSYFLCMIKKNVLRNIIFPLGEMTKKEVIEISKKESFFMPGYEDSQDLCFIEKDYKDFLRKRIGEKRGYLVYKDKVIGEHHGFYNFTIGQRKGLKISFGKRVYVYKTDPEKNIVYIGERREVMKNRIIVKDLNLFTEIKGENKFLVKIRNLHKESPARVKFNGKVAEVYFFEEQFAPTPGQIAAFYDGEILIGGGIIEEVY